MEQIETIYLTIACNVKQRRKHLHLTQAQLAELADISLDTIKSIEAGRRSMSLDTYLRVVEALETTPAALLRADPPQDCIDRLVFIARGRSENEIQFILHIIEQTLKAEELYIKVS